MGLLGELPPLRFGTWGHAKGCRQPLALSKPRQTQPLARARTGGSRSVSVLAQKRKLVDKVSATGETKRSRKMQPHEHRQEQLPGQQRTCRWFDPKVSEVDHFAKHSHAHHSQGRKGFCIRCDLHRNRKDYETIQRMGPTLAGLRERIVCALCPRSPTVGACDWCARRVCRGCLEELTGECWVCLGARKPSGV